MPATLTSEAEAQTLQPLNNLYKVPIEQIYLMGCSDGSILQGGRDSYLWVEADSPEDAKEQLKKSRDYADNYIKMPLKERKAMGIFCVPFRFREGEITKVLNCPRRFKAPRDGQAVCGMPLEDGLNGEFGGCCIAGYDILEGIGCPYADEEDR